MPELARGRMMAIGRLLPQRFGSRLFIMTLIAGLIPICIFSVLIGVYGREFQQEIGKAIQQAYDEEWAHNKTLLRTLGETSILQKAQDMALQLDLTLQSHPYMALRDLQGDAKFREIAVQQVGETGYTGLYESNTGIIRFNKDRKLENVNFKALAGKSPSYRFRSIMKESLGGKKASGYYDWLEADGIVKEKYMCIVPLRQATADGVFLSLSVITYMDEFTRPIKDAEAMHVKTAGYLSVAAERLFRSFRDTGFLFMGIGILTISFMALCIGLYFSRAITRLRHATKKVNEGDLNVSVSPTMSGEVRTLAEDFNRMVRKLAETTVSKELLEQSEQKLIAANSDLHREIEERTEAERALANEKERLAVTLRSIGDGVITTDRQGKIVLMNQAAERLTGWVQDEATGRSLLDVFCCVDGANRKLCYDPVHSVVEAGEAMSGPVSGVLIRPDGLERIVAQSGAPIRDEDGAIVGVVTVFRDTTEERKMEEELLKARKLESVGTLAGGVAHDFNNLLAVILGNISVAKLFLEPQSKAFTTLEQAESATLRSKDLTYRLLTFARGGEPVRRVTSLKELIDGSAALFLSDSNVTYTSVIAEDLYPAEVDQGQVRQVIHNLMMNAGDAMAEGGTITIRAENIVVGGNDGIPLPEGAYVRIAVEDQGSGIPEEDVQRIFDPYFTKKELGAEKGIGLGLAICYSIVKNHNGLMTVESEVGAGTTLYVYLPAYTAGIEKKNDTNLAESGHGRILFMDDEKQVRDVAGQILEYLGYEVEFAANGSSAIKLYEEAKGSGRPFDLLVMDLAIPDGMGGREAMRRLRELDPEVRAIVLSGYSNDPVMADFKAYGFREAVAKPYKIEELGEAIRKVMSTEG
jgi:PAS domain S-box-containing protein